MAIVRYTKCVQKEVDTPLIASSLQKGGDLQLFTFKIIMKRQKLGKNEILLWDNPGDIVSIISIANFNSKGDSSYDVIKKINYDKRTKILYYEHDPVIAEGSSLLITILAGNA